MKKTKTWLDEHSLAYHFHDYRKAGIDATTLLRWLTHADQTALINRRGTTWRKLTPAQQHIVASEDAISLMMAYPSIIRRPVIEFTHSDGGLHLLIGFDPETWQRTLVCALPQNRGKL